MPILRITTAFDLPDEPAIAFEAVCDPARWRFPGFGPVPAIARAQLVDGGPLAPGSVIRVDNADGSSHTEDVVVAEPGERFVLRMHLRPPLSRVLTGMEEELRFTPAEGGTRVWRQFRLMPRAWWAVPAAAAFGWTVLAAAIRRSNAALSAGEPSG